MLSDGAGPCLSTPSLMWKCAERGAASRRSLLLTINSRRGSEGLEGDLVAKAFELADKAIFVGVVAVAPQEVVGTEVVVRLLARKDVVGAHEDGVDDGADGLLVAAPASTCSSIQRRSAYPRARFAFAASLPTPSAKVTRLRV